MLDKIELNLGRLYGKKTVPLLNRELKRVISDFLKSLPLSKRREIAGGPRLSKRDLALIIYGDTIKDAAGRKKPLRVLREFINRYRLDKVFNIIHILPFYPWDTDRGFSVIDYYQVKPEYGGWRDIAALAKKARLMFDVVLNHASVKNEMIQGALIERHLAHTDRRYKNYFRFRQFVIAYPKDKPPPEEDLKKLMRPRPFPVLTKYAVLEDNQGRLKAILGEATAFTRLNWRLLGDGLVWTTFSRAKRADGSEDTCQVDINLRNPQVFLEIIRVILFYVRKGARLIRLDAVGYAWKKLGSSSFHEPEVHLLLETLRLVLKMVAPRVLLVAEVNAPQSQIISYLGTKDHPEADLVYQFSPFPLAVYAALSGNTLPYRSWLAVSKILSGRQFTTVLGSHDGMYLKGAKDYLGEKEFGRLINLLVNKYLALPNYSFLPGGIKMVYEICATAWNLVNSPLAKENWQLRRKRYLAVLATGLLIKGIPAIYINGLFGAENYRPKDGLDENRTVNREIFSQRKLFVALDEPTSKRCLVMQAVIKLLMIRLREKVFAPEAPPVKVIKNNNPAVISVLLRSADRKESLLAITNFSSRPQAVTLSVGSRQIGRKTRDLLSGNFYLIKTTPRFKLTISPYQILWLKKTV